MPRNDGLVSTKEAAAMSGCSLGTLIPRMRRYGFTPADQTDATRYGIKYWWRPADVMAARRMAKQGQEQARENIRRAHTTPARAYARERQLEAYRHRVLARIAARQATRRVA